jgi:hypothetical protein
LGLWIEQLIAGSTGKKGTGIVPIAGETLGMPEVYGEDRLFVRLRLHGGDPEEHDRDGKMERLRAAGFPMVTINLKEPGAIGAEFVRWEIATATAGAVLDINPFDEPNIQQAKDTTKTLLTQFTVKGNLPTPVAQVEANGLSLVCDRHTWGKIGPRVGSAANPLTLVAEFLRMAQKGDYVGLLAYLPFDQVLENRLARLRGYIRDRLQVATMFDYGPRYLHSTGQLHKGGVNTGVFLMITADPKEDLAIPGENFSFGTLELAQALGDFASLEATERRVMRLHLKAPESGLLDRVCQVIEDALPQ